MIIENVDSRKFRNSTHLAGEDVEILQRENGGKCILTIKKAYYATGVPVSGKSVDGYFIEFYEPVKPMKVNSTNRKTITEIVKELKGIPNIEARNTGSWIDTKIELYFDPNVRMGRDTTGGIRIVKKAVGSVDSINALSRLNACRNIEELKNVYQSLTQIEQVDPRIVEATNSMKQKLSGV